MSFYKRNTILSFKPRYFVSDDFDKDRGLPRHQPDVSLSINRKIEFHGYFLIKFLNFS